MTKLIIVACGAGINTSTIAEETLREALKTRGIKDVEVKRINMADVEKFIGQMVVIVEMTKSYRKFDVPQVKGLPFLIGSKEEREATVNQILDIVAKAP